MRTLELTWAQEVAVPHVMAEVNTVAKLIVDHFGSEERAKQLIELFPGRYEIRVRGEGLLGPMWGNTPGPKYTLIDKLRPGGNQ